MQVAQRPAGSEGSVLIAGFVEEIVQRGPWQRRPEGDSTPDIGVQQARDCETAPGEAFQRGAVFDESGDAIRCDDFRVLCLTAVVQAHDRSFFGPVDDQAGVWNGEKGSETCELAVGATPLKQDGNPLHVDDGR